MKIYLLRHGKADWPDWTDDDAPTLRATAFSGDINLVGTLSRVEA